MAKFLIFSDPHFTDIQSKCRTDNFFDAQKSKMLWLHNIYYDYKIDLVLCGGDVFDVPKPNPIVISNIIANCPDFIATAGQHDLPRHSTELIDESGLKTLDEANKIILLMENQIYTDHRKFCIYGFPYGSNLKKIKKIKLKYKYNIAIIHSLISHDFGGNSVKYISKIFKNFDLIVSGDNHRTFIYKSRRYKNIIINAGSLTRTKADQVNHKPCVFVWDSSEPLKYEKVEVPVKKNVISRKHLKISKEYAEMENAYVEKLNEDYSVGMSFEDNMEEHIRTNKTSKSITGIIWDNIEQAKTEGQIDGKHKQKRNY